MRKKFSSLKKNHFLFVCFFCEKKKRFPGRVTSGSIYIIIYIIILIIRYIVICYNLTATITLMNLL